MASDTKQQTYIYDSISPTVTGSEFTKAYSVLIDEFLAGLFANATQVVGVDVSQVALLAVGGYGRRELCPHSDIDVLLVHNNIENIDEFCEKLWYPVWDEGLSLGHSVVTLSQLEELIRDNFEWSTSILDAHLVGGSSELGDKASSIGRTWWTSDVQSKLRTLQTAVKERQRSFGDAAFQIEPNLKNGRGGLRDVHALRWAEKAQPGFVDDDLSRLAKEWELLLAARVELHRATRSSTNKLTFNEQDDIYPQLWSKSAASLMQRLARAARRVGWHSDNAWRRWKATNEDACKRISLGPDDSEFECVDGTLAIREEIDIEESPCLVLKLASLAAVNEMPMNRRTLGRLADSAVELETPWGDEERSQFVDLFSAGPSTIRVVEDLDHFGLMEVIFPEWAKVSCKPQRNALHTFTVDRHLCEAAATAADIYNNADPERKKRLKRKDLLVVGALLHDIGKGFPGDHTEVGVELIAEIGERMGFDSSDIDILVDLCEHHLLLPDVATRRDLADPATAALVAGAVDNVEFLHLLHAMTEADALSTGPSAWGNWKADLVMQLVSRTEKVLVSGKYETSESDEFPDAGLLQRMRAGELVVKGRKETFTVVQTNVPTLFSTMAGVLGVSGLRVLRASVASVLTDESRMDDIQVSYACRFVVQRPGWGDINWYSVSELAAQAIDGHLAISPRLLAKKQELSKRRKRISAEPPRRSIEVDNDGSDTATILEVHSRSILGLLYSLTSGLRNLDISIIHAQVQTFGPQMVTTFYVSNRKGYKITDETLIAEIKLAINHTLNRITD